MSALKKISRTGLCVAFAAIGAPNLACSSEFTSCYAARSCAPDLAGSAGVEEAAGSAETAGTSDSAGAGGDGGNTERSNDGAAGEVQAGTAGDLDNAGAGGAEETGGDAHTGGSGAGIAGIAGSGATASSGGTSASGGNDGNACNALVQEGPQLTTEDSPNLPIPTGTKGTINPGKYFLTRAEFFGSYPTGPIAGTLYVTVQGSVATLQGAIVAIATPVSYTATLTLNDPPILFYTCQEPEFALLGALNSPTAIDYTATTTTLALIVPNSAGAVEGYRLTFTKQ